MNRWDTLAIVGVGLIGGSIGLAVRQRQLARRVIGVGRSSRSLQLALKLGTVHEVTENLAEAARQAELIIVCTPVGTIANFVRQAAQACRREALITDAGSTKAEIIRGVGKLPRGARFVGSHPLAGSEKSGPAEARADLFQQKLVVVTPTSRTPARDLREVTQFWEALGAHVAAISPARHDRLLALASHMPHLVAAALSASIPPASRPFAASGLRDTTRIAAGDPELWEQITTSNRSAILKALDAFDRSLRELRQAIAHGNNGRLRKLLRKGKENRDALGS